MSSSSSSTGDADSALMPPPPVPPVPPATDTAASSVSRAAADVGDEDLADDDDREDRPVVCLFHGGGRLGACAYSLESAALSVLADVDDLAPAFNVTQAVMAQLNPAVVLVSGRQSQEFLMVVRAMVGEDEDDRSERPRGEGDDDDEERADTTSGDAFTATTAAARATSSASAPNDPSTVPTKDAAIRDAELILLPGKEFRYPACRSRVLATRLPQEKEAEEKGGGAPLSDEDRFVLINSYFDLGADSSVRAAGALLRFMDTNRVAADAAVGAAGDLAQAANAGGGSLVLSVSPIVPAPLLSLDQTTLTALQVFNPGVQPAGARSGSWNKTREGLSVFRLLNRCRSASGSRYLRCLCRCPSSDPDVIAERQSAVAFLSSPRQRDVAQSLRRCLGGVRNVPALLKRLATTQAGASDWKAVKRSVSALLAVREVCCQHGEDVAVFRSIRESDADDVYAVADYLERVFDAEASAQRHKFTVKSGVDPELDEKRRVHNGLPDLLLKVAEEEIADLPEFMTECSMVYVPQIGYLLSVQPWADDLNVEEDFRLPPLQFMFHANEVPYFKTPRCRELDEVLGDTATAIAERETALMIRLVGFLTACSAPLLALAHHAAVLDCLLALAAVAAERDWRRPTVMPADRCDSIDIAAGRHPLLEITASTVVPNPTKMGDDEKVMVLTGPNACGKSVYLKQVGLIAYLAHVGSFVPAESATLPALSAIRTRMQTVDSLSLGLSAFAVDLNQMSSALRSAAPNALLLVDEFGKGTCEADGRALLAACTEHLLAMGRDRRPFALLSTHFHDVPALLASTDGARFCTFEHVCNGGDLVFLYRLADGRGSGSSRALTVAKRAGLEEKVVVRAAKVLDGILTGRSIAGGGGEDGGDGPDDDAQVYDMEMIEDAVEAFFEADLDDPVEVAKIMERFRNL